MSKTSPHFVRDYRARFPINGARINVTQAIAYWLHIAKELPPLHCVDAMHVLLTLHPARANEQETTTAMIGRNIAQVEAWRQEHDALEDETLAWLNAPLNADAPEGRRR